MRSNGVWKFQTISRGASVECAMCVLGFSRSQLNGGTSSTNYTFTMKIRQDLLWIFLPLQLYLWSEVNWFISTYTQFCWFLRRGFSKIGVFIQTKYIHTLYIHIWMHWIRTIKPFAGIKSQYTLIICRENTLCNSLVNSYTVANEQA